MRAYFGIMFISLGLSGCFYMPVVSKGKVSTLDESPRMAATVSSTESKAIAAYDPSSKVPTTIPAPSGALSGSSVTLPAGALAIAAELVVEEAVPLSQTSLTSSLAINSDVAIKPVGSGLIIRPTEHVDLTRPLTIAMPINPTAGLHSWLTRSLALNAGKHYAVFYKYFLNGELKAGVIPTGTLRFSDNGSILFEGYFGAYWLAEVSAPIEEKIEVKTEEPIVNKDNVAVVSQTGVVTETEVVAKASIPPVEWLGVTLTLDASQRTVKAAARIGAGRSVNDCKVDLFEKTTSSSGITVDSGSRLDGSYKVTKQEAHSLYARFRCFDDQARLATSPWSDAVSLSAIVAPAPATKPTYDFCGTSPSELRLTVGMGTGPMLKSIPFTVPSSCAYAVDFDSMGDFAFGIQTADGVIKCSASSVKLGTQTLSCGNSSEAPQPMPLPQGNYRFKLDFSVDSTRPQLTVMLQPCAIGDLHLLIQENAIWPTPNVSNRMQNLGGCQYAMQTGWTATGSTMLRISNSSGTYVCTGSGMGSTDLRSDRPLVLKCGSSTEDSIMQNSGAYYGQARRYLVNLGENLDMQGNPTSVPYLHYTEIDNCMDRHYLLGPTAAGNSRIPDVNLFRKDSTMNCTFKYYWLNTMALTPFYIGRGETGEKCGVAVQTPGNPTVSLDCSATALPIDFQDLEGLNLTGKVLGFELVADPMTGNAVSLHVFNEADMPCHDTYYALKSVIKGYYFDPSRVLTEVRPCVYEYDWIPSTMDRGFALLPSASGGMASYYGVYLGQSQPIVNGPAVNLTRFEYYSSEMVDYEFPIRPWGIMDGQRYKLTLDLRMGTHRPKVSIATHSAFGCPDLYVIGGLPGWDGKSSANRMTRVGDCNYALTFNASAAGTNFHIADANDTILCGMDAMAGDPISPGPSVPMVCSSAEPTPFTVSLAALGYYQIRVHFDGAELSRIAFQQYYPSCVSSEFAGPAAEGYMGSKYFNYVNGEMCLQEFYWTPLSSTKSFKIKDMSGSMKYCGLHPGAPQLSLSGTETEAICNAMGANQVVDFTILENLVLDNTYRILLDRRNPFAPARISIMPGTPP
jgi:hypothetical protein